MTNNHVINEDNIIQGNKISITLINDKISVEIEIDNDRKTFTDKDYDITIIELKENELKKIDINSFFYVDDQIYNEDFKNLYKNKSVYLIGFPKGGKSKFSNGKIINILEDNFTIIHKCSTEPGSSGCPIINLENNKVIGIHKGAYSKGDFNLGTVLKEPLEKFIEKNLKHKIKNNKKEFNSNEEKLINSYQESVSIKSKDSNNDLIKNNNISNELYDVIILGSSLKENILAALLSEKGCDNKRLKILQLDKNNYIGSNTVSLNLKDLFDHFRPVIEPSKKYGQSEEWNVDLISKFILSNGNMFKILSKINAFKKLKFKSCNGEYIYRYHSGGFFSKGRGNIHKISPNEIKNKYKKFFEFIQDYEKDNPSTHQKIDPNSDPKCAIEIFGLDQKTFELIGHAFASFTCAFRGHMGSFIQNIKSYMNSFDIYGNSSFIYPVFGLGKISKVFSEFFISNGGTCILNRDIDNILYDNFGNFRGIKSKGEEINGKILIANPYYIKNLLPHSIRNIGQIFRRICILDHHIPKTDCSSSGIIILPSNHRRYNDIIITFLNYDFSICRKDYFVVFISTIIETCNPIEEIKDAMELIGPVLETFDEISDMYMALNNIYNNIYINSSYDVSHNFENEINDVLDIYEKISKKK